ncbi:MAG: ABC transporter permease [Candidatus Binataceae bacterium]
MFLLTLRNMSRRINRTLLTVTTVALASFIFVILVSVPATIDRIVADASRGLRLIVNAPNAYYLPVRYRDIIRKMPHVVGCVSEAEWHAIYQDPRDVIIAYGIEPDAGTVFDDPDYRISAEVARALASDRRAALVGTLLMKKHNWTLGKPVILVNPDRRMTLTFIPVGQIPSKHSPNSFVFRRELLEEAVKRIYGINLEGRASFLVVRVDSADNVPLVINEIDQTFHNSDVETRTMTESDSITNSISSVENIRGIIFVVCSAIILTMLLITANSMAMSVRDRIREIAILRTLGFGIRHVAVLILGEAAITGFFGGVLGVLPALFLFSAGTTLGTGPGSVVGGTGYMEVTAWSALQALGVAIAVSLASGLVPLLSAMHVPPALAVRKPI